MEDTQRNVEQNRRDLAFGLETDARELARVHGGRAVDVPSIAKMPTVTPRGFADEDRVDMPVFELDQGLLDRIGEQEFAQRGAVATRASELESAFRGGEALDFEEQLIF